MIDLEKLRSFLNQAHLMMPLKGDGPQPLGALLQLVAQATGDASYDIPSAVRREMISADPNNPVRGLFGQMLRAWDFVAPSGWNRETPGTSAERRAVIYELLQLTEHEQRAADELVPFADMHNTNIVIAEKHDPWYTGPRRDAGFYWSNYEKYLRNAGWEHDGIHDLSEASDLILERLADPYQPKVFQTKGIVVGYVQSGKTANFTAVVAKAVDAGYRLIIIFGGVLDILRAQTQRRIDMELVGQELIAAAAEGGIHDYVDDRDWKKFVRYGEIPSRLGHFDLERLTGFKDDYQSARRHSAALEFTSRFPDRPLNHRDNIRHAPVHLVILKKNPARIAALRKDLGRLRTTPLGQIPTLVIDDESDQASVNTTKPRKDEVRKRSATNDEITKLLGLLPRAQYVGYTATPFANVFVDPSDAADLFPKDFMISLKRPSGYMGVRDFFDFDEDGRTLDGDERPEGFDSNERAFLRDIRARQATGGQKESDDEKERRCLGEAVDSFVLSGAVKLFRESVGVPVKTQHHTMLVHRSTAQADHMSDSNLVREVFDSGLYLSGASTGRLRQLWNSDFQPVSEVRAQGLPIPTFEALTPYIGQAIDRILRYGGGNGPVRIVNAEPGMAEQVPDFFSENVWSILVGGAKLSRGFTVEGLTVSYFRRRTRTSDTLMQAGRWFGFRRGYQDLVRVYLGREEPLGRGTTYDLLEAFKSICLDEEMFRAQLRRYTQDQGPGVPPVTPKQIPPLVPQHLLRPTATNKMYNAKVEVFNFGGEWKESTVAFPLEGARAAENIRTLRGLLEKRVFQRKSLGSDDPADSKKIQWTALVADATPTEILALLNTLQWIEGTEGYVDERRFLAGKGDLDPGIDRWLIIAPQQSDDVPVWRCGNDFKVVKRPVKPDVRGNPRYTVFSERRHRAAVQAIAKAKDHTGLTPDTQRLVSERTAIMILYPAVRVTEGRGRVAEDTDVTLGFALQFPANKIRGMVLFGVKDKTRPTEVVVPME